MSVNWEEASKRYVVRFRDVDGRHRSVTVNVKNLDKYGLPIPSRVTERIARRLEAEILRRETSDDGHIRALGRQGMLYLDVVARYIPPVLDKNNNDKWSQRPQNQPLENERTYSDIRLYHMRLVLTNYFPSYIEHGRINWRRRGKRKHSRTEAVKTCTRPIGKITREDVAGFQIYLTNNQLAAATIRGYMVTLKTFLSWCVERGFLYASPADTVKLPQRRKRQVEWLESEKIQTLLAAMKNSPLDGPVRTVLCLGLRRSEMVNLEWDDLNFHTGIVRVRGTKTANAYREVPLPKTLARFFKSLERSKIVPNVLVNTDGWPWNKDSLSSSLRRFKKAGHVSFKWNYQILRATYGSLLVQKGIPISHVSMVMGHADVRTTQNWYIGLNSTHVAPQIAKVIAQIF
jgi:integrase